ncbi:MAG: YlbF family regulator [Clostridia bacterium]|nr:YlbF family regulator [Clostridia bacterium]
MGILEVTRKLGEEIQKDERFIAYAKAKIEVDNNKELQDKIGEFNITRMNLEQESEKDTRDEEKIKELNESLRNIYSAVMGSKAMLDFNTAKGDLDHIINDINSVIMQCVDGADPKTVEPETHSCSGSCDSCGGCH